MDCYAIYGTRCQGMRRSRIAAHQVKGCNMLQSVLWLTRSSYPWRIMDQLIVSHPAKRTLPGVRSLKESLWLVMFMRLVCRANIQPSGRASYERDQAH